MQWCVRSEMVWGVMILLKLKCPEPTLFKNVLTQLKNSIQPQMEQQWAKSVQINVIAGQNSKCKSGVDQDTNHVFFQVNIYLYCISELTGVPVALTTIDGDISIGAPLVEIGLRWLPKLGMDTSPCPHAHRRAWDSNGFHIKWIFCTQDNWKK